MGARFLPCHCGTRRTNDTWRGSAKPSATQHSSPPRARARRRRTAWREGALARTRALTRIPPQGRRARAREPMPGRCGAIGREPARYPHPPDDLGSRCASDAGAPGKRRAARARHWMQGDTVRMAIASFRCYGRSDLAHPNTHATRRASGAQVAPQRVVCNATSGARAPHTRNASGAGPERTSKRNDHKLTQTQTQRHTDTLTLRSPWTTSPRAYAPHRVETDRLAKQKRHQHQCATSIVAERLEQV